MRILLLSLLRLISLQSRKVIRFLLLFYLDLILVCDGGNSDYQNGTTSVWETDIPSSSYEGTRTPTTLLPSETSTINVPTTAPIAGNETTLASETLSTSPTIDVSSGSAVIHTESGEDTSTSE